MARRTRSTKAPQPARDINRAQRILEAQRLRVAGWEWEDIATQLGIRGGRGAAYVLVNNALIQALREGDKAMRELENRRLDALHVVYWPKALEGDGWSHDRILRQMEHRAALNGLKKPVDDGIASQNVRREYVGVDLALMTGEKKSA
jgi:hypothetical protein